MTPILLIFSLTCLLQAATDQPTDRTVTANAVRDAQTAPILRPDDDSRTPLLREGTFLNQVPGTIHFDSGTGFWRFHNDVAEGLQATRYGRTFGLLPSSALADAVSRIESSKELPRFEISARVTVYRGMNYLLPTLLTAISDLSMDDQSEVIPAGEPAASGAEPSRSPRNSLDDADDTADRLEERLRSRLGSLPVSSETTPETTPGAGHSTGTSMTMAEGDRIQNRRCSILRDQRSGTWRILFSSEAADQRDPTMEILPCLLLEKLQRRAAQSDLPESILLSGEITRYQGRNYLLPTRWRPTSSSSNIQR